MTRSFIVYYVGRRFADIWSVKWEGVVGRRNVVALLAQVAKCVKEGLTASFSERVGMNNFLSRIIATMVDDLVIWLNGTLKQTDELLSSYICDWHRRYGSQRILLTVSRGRPVTFKGPSLSLTSRRLSFARLRPGARDPFRCASRALVERKWGIDIALHDKGSVHCSLRPTKLYESTDLVAVRLATLAGFLIDTSDWLSWAFYPS